MKANTKKIKILLIKKDLTQTAIANEFGVTVGAVNNVIQGIRKSRRLRERISSKLGREVHQLFSDAA